MNAKPTDDLTLARRAGTGDEAALAILYERYADLLFAFICHRLEGSSLDAESVWQETLMAAVRSLPQYRGQGRFFAWLRGIARRKIATHFRRSGQRAGVFSETVPEEIASPIASGPLPEEVLARQETRTRVIEALAMLPVEYRRALVGRYADGRSVEAVAKLLGKTYKATESLLGRARSAFRAAFSSLDGETDDDG